MHRSEVYFERCYAADRDPRVPIEQRRACWQAWIEHYRHAQPAERVDYAREQLLRLDPQRAEVVELAVGEPFEAPVDATMPTTAAPEASGHEEPPQPDSPDAVNRPPQDGLVEVVGPPPAPAAPRDAALQRRQRRAPVMPPGEAPHCAEACRPRWEACTARCGGGSERAGCLRACRLALRTCSHACY